MSGGDDGNDSYVVRFYSSKLVVPVCGPIPSLEWYVHSLYVPVLSNCEQMEHAYHCGLMRSVIFRLVRTVQNHS